MQGLKEDRVVVEGHGGNGAAEGGCTPDWWNGEKDNLEFIDFRLLAC